MLRSSRGLFLWRKSRLSTQSLCLRQSSRSFLDPSSRSSLCFSTLPPSSPPQPNHRHYTNNNNKTNHQHQQYRRKSVFVSKHNQSFNVTAEDILQVVPDMNHRTTSTHVILEECPFCTKPTRGQPDNQYKLYVQLQGGAYFCHRCGSGGSWFDFKARLGSGGTAAAYEQLDAGMSSSGSSGNNNNSPSGGEGTSPPYQRYSRREEAVQPLPLPSPRLQALYSSNLLDASSDTNNNAQNHTVLDYLTQTRGLTPQTLRKYGVGKAEYSFYSPTEKQWKPMECVTFPWIMSVQDVAYQEELRGSRFEHESINKATTDTSSKDEKKSKKKTKITNDSPFLTRRIKVRALNDKSMQRLDPAGGGWGLFGYHTTLHDTEKREIVVTEGEYDAMAVWQATGRPAVSLPNGCRSLPVETLPLLEDFDKVYLWMDNDGPGQEGAELFAKKIGLGRCYMVRPTEENTGITNSIDLPKDANEALLQDLDLEKIVSDAKLVPHERILNFDDLRQEVLHEILHPEMYVGTPVTSLPGFTKIIQGLRKGELTVITGPTGSGKTTFLGQMSLDLAEQGINVLWGSFEIRNTRLMHKLLQQFARQPLPRGEHADADLLQDIADRFSTLPMNFLKFHGGSDVDDVLEAMEYAVYVHDCQHIVLDNLQFMISRQSTNKNTFDKFDAQDIAIEKFRAFATEKNVHVTLVVHPRKEDETNRLSISSIYGSAKATQEADTVLILQNENSKKYLDVRKNRFNGDLGQTPLFFDRNSCRYSETPTVMGNAAKNNGSGTNNANMGKPVVKISTPAKAKVTAGGIANHWDSILEGHQDEP